MDTHTYTASNTTKSQLGRLKWFLFYCLASNRSRKKRRFTSIEIVWHWIQSEINLSNITFCFRGPLLQYFSPQPKQKKMKNFYIRGASRTTSTTQPGSMVFLSLLLYWHASLGCHHKQIIRAYLSSIFIYISWLTIWRCVNYAQKMKPSEPGGYYVFKQHDLQKWNCVFLIHTYTFHVCGIMQLKKQQKKQLRFLFKIVHYRRRHHFRIANVQQILSGSRFPNAIRSHTKNQNKSN